jgi:hypothetical protein
VFSIFYSGFHISARAEIDTVDDSSPLFAAVIRYLEEAVKMVQSVAALVRLIFHDVRSGSIFICRDFWTWPGVCQIFSLILFFFFSDLLKETLTCDGVVTEEFRRVLLQLTEVDCKWFCLVWVLLKFHECVLIWFWDFLHFNFLGSGWFPPLVMICGSKVYLRDCWPSSGQYFVFHKMPV